MKNWIRSLDKSQHKEPKIPNESWENSRYGPQYMNWAEAQAEYIEPLKKTVGKAWFALRKLWQEYRKAGVLGKERSDIAYNILKHQYFLDLPPSTFSEIEHLDLEVEFGPKEDSKTPQLEEQQFKGQEEDSWSTEEDEWSEDSDKPNWDKEEWAEINRFWDS